MTPAHGEETIVESFASVARGPRSGTPALAGLRDAETWVEYTYAELLDEVERASGALAGLGLGAGDVLCLVLPNWTEAVVYGYAALRLGIVICPVTTIYRERELGFIIERTAAKAIVLPGTYRRYDYAALGGRLRDAHDSLEHVVVVGGEARKGLVSSASLLAGAATAPAAAPAPDDLAILAFTSGTTGEPKGVMHSHASIHAAIDGLADHAALGRPLRSLVISPFGHLTGLTWGVAMTLRYGGSIVLLETWDPAAAVELIERYDIEITVGATAFLSDLLHLPEPRLPGIFVCAGAPIPPIYVERAADIGSRVIAAWGMSEYPIGSAVGAGDDPSLSATSDGRASGPAELRIVDEEGRPVGVGDEGDLEIRGPGLFIGYYKRPDLDDSSRTPDGFLRTGDRARLVDERGFIRISGRTKDIIIRGGENIPVVEIENLLLEHPAISEIALVPVPDDRLGERACACIVPTDGAGELTLADLSEFLSEQGAARQFVPEYLALVRELPRTPSGKIQKFALRELAMAAAQGTEET